MKKEYISPEFSFIAVQTSDVITTSPVIGLVQSDSEDNWTADAFPIK